MTTILVTGATGNVGSHVVRDLRDRGVSVRAFVRDREKATHMLGGDVDLVTGDFADAASVQRAVAGVDAVFLSCANHPQQVAYETTVIDAAAAAGVRRLLKLSTIGAEPGSPLDFWDAQGRIEAHLRRVFPQAVILRSNFYMSNLLGAADQVRGLGKVFAPADGARIGMIDPRDVAAVAAIALTTGAYDGQTLVLTGPESITYARAAEELSVATGRPVEFVPVPDEAARQSMVGAGMPEWLAGNVVKLFGILRRGTTDVTTGTVRAVTGREPRTFGQFARDHAPLFKAAG